MMIPVIMRMKKRSAITANPIPDKPVLFITMGQSNHNGNAVQSNITQLASLRPDLIGPLGGGAVYSFREAGTPLTFNYANWNIETNTGDAQWGYSATVRTAAAFHCSLFDELFKAWNIPLYVVLHGRDGTRLYQDASSTDWNINSTNEHYATACTRIDTAVAWMEA